MVSKRSNTTALMAGKQRRPALAVALPHDLVVDIVSLVATTSVQPITDLASIRAASKCMYAACNERYVGRRVALINKEEKMKWRENTRYHAVLDSLVAVGNPEACFLAGVTLIFDSSKQQQQLLPEFHGLVLLDQAAVAGHKGAAYVLGLLLYTSDSDNMRDMAEQYIGQVEGDAVGCETVKRTNRECKQWRRLVTGVLQEMAWKKKAGLPGRVPVTAPEDAIKRCKVKGCGVPADGWSDYDVFCSDDCRIKNEHIQFFIDVSSYLP